MGFQCFDKAGNSSQSDSIGCHTNTKTNSDSDRHAKSGSDINRCSKSEHDGNDRGLQTYRASWDLVWC